MLCMHECGFSWKILQMHYFGYGGSEVINIPSNVYLFVNFKKLRSYNLINTSWDLASNG